MWPSIALAPPQVVDRCTQNSCQTLLSRGFRSVPWYCLGAPLGIASSTKNLSLAIQWYGPLRLPSCYLLLLVRGTHTHTRAMALHALQFLVYPPVRGICHHASFAAPKPIQLRAFDYIPAGTLLFGGPGSPLPSPPKHCVPLHKHFSCADSVFWMFFAPPGTHAPHTHAHTLAWLLGGSNSYASRDFAVSSLTRLHLGNCTSWIGSSPPCRYKRMISPPFPQCTIASLHQVGALSLIPLRLKGKIKEEEA